MIEIALSVTIMLLLTIVSVFIRPLSTGLVLALGGGTIILLTAGYIPNTYNFVVFEEGTVNYLFLF